MLSSLSILLLAIVPLMAQNQKGPAVNTPLPFGGPINPNEFQQQLPQLLQQPSLRSGESIEAPFRNGPPPNFNQPRPNIFSHIPPNNALFQQRKQPPPQNNFGDIRRAQPQPTQHKPTAAVQNPQEENPCPQPTWQKIMLENIKPKDSTASLNAIQAGLGRALKGHLFMVLCTDSEEKAKFGKTIKLETKGDGYCNVEKEGVSCQVVKLSSGAGVTLNGFGGLGGGQGFSLLGKK